MKKMVILQTEGSSPDICPRCEQIRDDVIAYLPFPFYTDEENTANTIRRPVKLKMLSIPFQPLTCCGCAEKHTQARDVSNFQVNDAYLYKVAEARLIEAYTILNAIFSIASDVHQCRSCHSPVVHMEHMTMDEAKDIEKRARVFLGLLEEEEEAEWDMIVKKLQVNGILQRMAETAIKEIDWESSLDDDHCR